MKNNFFYENLSVKCVLVKNEVMFLIKLLFLGINDKIISGICKILQIILPRYRDIKSQNFVKTLLIALVKEHPIWTLKHMTNVLNDIANQNKNLVPT